MSRHTVKLDFLCFLKNKSCRLKKNAFLSFIFKPKVAMIMNLHWNILLVKWCQNADSCSNRVSQNKECDFFFHGLYYGLKVWKLLSVSNLTSHSSQDFWSLLMHYWGALMFFWCDMEEGWCCAGVEKWPPSYFNYIQECKVSMLSCCWSGAVLLNGRRPKTAIS